MSPSALDLWGAVWGQNGPIGRLVVGMILALALPAVLTALRHLGRYGGELAALARAEANLAQWQVDDGDSENAETGATGDGADVESSRLAQPAQIETLLLGVDPRSLVAARLDSLRRLSAHRTRIDLATLQELTRAREAAQPGGGLPSFAGSTALLLGILGTFVGLAAMVQQIDVGLPSAGVAAVDSWTSSLANLRQVLAGMRTAFSTSLVGMGTAVTCFSLDFWIGRRRACFHERLERFTIQELLPAVAPGMEDQVLLERLSVQLESSFQRLDAVFAANREVLRDLSGAEHTFAAIVDEIRKVTNSDARQDLRQVIANMDKTSRSFLELSAQLPSLVTAVERGSNRASHHVEVLLRRWFPAGVAIVVLCVWIAMAVTQ